MYKLLFTNIIVASVIIASSCAQDKQVFEWPNGAVAALSLTYDDGLPSQVYTAVPMLNRYKFKATFYPTLASPSLYTDMAKWKDLPNQGHELGNHTVYHPCQKSSPDMDWVPEYYDLDKYTPEQIAEEIRVANTLLLAMDGKQSRTFAYPCAHSTAGGTSYRPTISSNFSAARDSSEEQVELPSPSDIDLNSIPSWAVNNNSAEEIIAYINKIIDQKTYSTITFHGIGAQHMIVTKEVHEEILRFLDNNRHKIWVATVKEVAAYIASKRTN